MGHSGRSLSGGQLDIQVWTWRERDGLEIQIWGSSAERSELQQGKSVERIGPTILPSPSIYDQSAGKMCKVAVGSPPMEESI